MRKTGRILHLLADPDAIERQLHGDDLHPARGAAYAYGVNTDAMISGRACTLGYTPEILGPHFLQDYRGVVHEGDIARGGFQILVGGHAYGTGSSREAAVVAHQGAGIELVVADSFQRIFQENMVFSGMPFTTDRSVLTRLEQEEDVPAETFTEGLPPLFRAVAERGGLLAYANAMLDGEQGPTWSIERTARPMTITEKIIARHVWRGPGLSDGVCHVRPGEQVLARVAFRGMHEYTTGMVMSLYEQAFGNSQVVRPDEVAVFEDHFVLLSEDEVPDAVQDARLAPARRLTEEMLQAALDHGLTVHGPSGDRAAGVCHRVVVEEYALPGQIICLTDSHTPTAGVLNTFAFGVGSTAMAFALRTGLMPVTVPRTIRVELTGMPRQGLSPKDVILHLIGSKTLREETWRTSPTDTCVLEFGGPALQHWSVDELSVLTNMTVEGGMMTGVVEPCEPVRRFLSGKRQQRIPEGFVRADEGAEYAEVIHLHLPDVPLTVATPGDSRNRSPLDEQQTVPIHNVVIASCTGGSLDDLRAAARVLRGRAFADGVRVTVTPSSERVAEAAEAEGVLQVFRDLGATITPPGCGSCIGNGPGIPEAGETTVSTTNRNFARRMGAPGPVYLASPAVAAASAVTGYLTDPTRLPPLP